MKVIYIADGLSPTAIKNPNNKNFYFDEKSITTF